MLASSAPIFSRQDKAVVPLILAAWLRISGRQSPDESH